MCIGWDTGVCSLRLLEHRISQLCMAGTLLGPTLYLYSRNTMSHGVSWLEHWVSHSVAWLVKNLKHHQPPFLTVYHGLTIMGLLMIVYGWKVKHQVSQCRKVAPITPDLKYQVLRVEVNLTPLTLHTADRKEARSGVVVCCTLRKHQQALSPAEGAKNKQDQ